MLANRRFNKRRSARRKPSFDAPLITDLDRRRIDRLSSIGEIPLCSFRLYMLALESRMKKRRSKLSKAYYFSGLKHWVLLASLFAYAVIGGAIFMAVEQNPAQQEEQRLNESLEEGISNFSTLVLHEATGDHHRSEQAIRVMLGDLIKSISSQNRYAKIRPTWGILQSTFYACTLFTTIGYGVVTPVTVAGKIITVIYSIAGIPLTLVVLEDVGGVLANVLAKITDMIIKCKIIQFFKDRFGQCQKRIAPDYEMDSEGGLVANSDSSTASADPVEVEDETIANIQLALALIMWTIWLLACAGIYRFIEDWSYGDSAYFFFISLSTIGLGDLVPSNKAAYLITFPLIFTGLALMSMSFSLIQRKLTSAKDYAVEELEELFGLDKSSHEVQSSIVRNQLRATLGILQAAIDDVIQQKARKGQTSAKVRHLINKADMIRKATHAFKTQQKNTGMQTAHTSATDTSSRRNSI